MMINPLNSKLPCFQTSDNDPGTAIALLQDHCLWAQFAGPQQSSSFACLAFIRGLSKVSYSGLPPERTRIPAFAILHGHGRFTHRNITDRVDKPA